MKNSWWLTLFNPVDISSLVYFRIIFGLVMMWEAAKYFENRWITNYWILPEFNFPYPFFEWVTPWSGQGMYIHVAILGLLALFITLGLFYRISITLFFLGFSYIFLLDEANYLNHFYLVILISFLMIFLPLNRKWALDLLIWPKLESDNTPAWTLWLLRFQIGVPYFFGGVAKLNLDWFQGEPMRLRLAKRMDFPLIGQFFDQEWMVYLYSYGGLFLDLLAMPLLLWRRTRLLTFFLLLLFHLNNAYMFSIGIFPWFMIAATALYFDPAWPKLIWDNMRSGANHWRILSVISAIGLAFVAILSLVGTEKVVFEQDLVERITINIEPIPIIIAASAGILLIWALAGKLSTAKTLVNTTNLPTRGMKFVGIGLLIWCSVQILVPLRHYLYPSNVHWTEEGHRFAWHMMLRDKEGRLRFLVRDSAGRLEQITAQEIVDLGVITKRQYGKMATRPFMMHQFAHYLAEKFEEANRPNVKIYIFSEASLNGRDPQTLVDPKLDFADLSMQFGHSVGAVPLTTPLKNSESLVNLEDE